MEGNLFARNKGVIFLSFTVITIITFYPLFQSGFGCPDDLQTYMVARSGGIFQNAKYLAELAGRFYYLFIQPVFALPYLWDSPFVVKLFHHIPLLTGVILFAVILFRLVRSRELAFLYFLVFLATAQASRHTSLLVTYPFFFTFSFDLLLLSFIFLLRYFENFRKPDLAVSVILFTAGLLFNESYLLYLLIFAAAILGLWYRKERKSRAALKQAFYTFLPFLGAGVLYLAVYLIYRGFYPSHYVGTSIDSEHLTIRAFFRAIWDLSLTSFPLTAFQENRYLFTDRSELVRGYVPVVLNIILTAKVEWIIKGICVALGGFIILSSIRRFSYKVLLTGIGVGVLLIFLPHAPLALTEKYLTQAAGGTKGYVTTFFSLFGTVLILAMLLAYLANLLDRRLKQIVVALFASGLFVCSVLTDFNNYYVVKDIRNSNLRLYALDELLKTDSFRSIPPNSIIYADHLTRTWSYCAGGLIKRTFDWSNYIRLKTDIRYRTFNNYADIPVSDPGSPRPVYSIYARTALRTDEIMMVLTKLNPKGPADLEPQPYVNQVWVLYYSPYKKFTVSFRVKDDSIPRSAVIYVNQNKTVASLGKVAKITFLKKANDEASSFFTIQVDQIDPYSILISNLTDPFTANPYIL